MAHTPMVSDRLILRCNLKLLHVEADHFWSMAIVDAVRSWTEACEVGVAKSGVEALARCRALAPDFVLFDAALPDMDGFDMAHELSRMAAPPRLLLFTERCDDALLYGLSRSPADGVIWKIASAAAQLRAALAAILAGRKFFSPETQEAMRRLRCSPDAYFKILSEREIDLVRRFGRGEPLKQIAADLNLCPSTVKWHRAQIMGRLGLHRTVDLMRWAEVRGLVEHLRPAPPCVTRC